MRALVGGLLSAVLAGFVNGPTHGRAQVLTTGAITAQSPCQFATFEEQTSSTTRFYSKAEFDRAKSNASIECLRIQYLSDGLKVVGFLVKPRDTEGRRFPVIIYNRGGLQDIGTIVYAKGSHQALDNRRDRDARIVAWFRRYLR